MSKQNKLSSYDSNNVLRDAHNEANNALDVVAVNNLVPSRYSKIELDYLTTGNGTGEVGNVYYYSEGEKQQQTIIFRNDEIGVAHKTSLSFYNRTPQNLANTYLVIYDDVGPVGVFFNLDGANTPPVTNEVYRFIQVAILSSDTEVQLANKLIAATDADSKFFSIGNQAFAVVSNSTAGVRTDSYDVNTNLYITNSKGINKNTLNDTFFYINSASNVGQYYVYYNVAGTGTDPLIAGKTAIEVALSSGATAVQVAAATGAALSTLFLTNISSNVVIITNLLIGVTTQIQDVTCRFTSVTLDIPGSDRQLVAQLVLGYDVSNNIISVERL